MSKRFIIRMSPRARRHRRVRARIIGTAQRPRLSVFRSAKHVYAQLIDDAAGRTVAAASDSDVSVSDTASRKTAIAHAVGGVLAKRAVALGVSAVVFDRGGYTYHGRVQAVADGAREGGLTL
ncbi:MAG: 50S ribosomal protein L18 [bacterium]|nr:50S ribosomal protein L18 [bacterium]